VKQPPNDKDWTEEVNKERLKQTVGRLNDISQSMGTHDLMEVPDFEDKIMVEDKKEEPTKPQEEKKDGQV
jgi:hypothetical protein